jgi:hypothetical protein
MTPAPRDGIGIRWTIGDVSDRGFEALGLSIRGAWRIFGGNAAYTVCVNKISPGRARAQVGPVPGPVEWLDATDAMPQFLQERFDEAMAEGVGWKLAPLRVHPGRFELSLDNDCILWGLPPTIGHWLSRDDGGCLMAEDVRACYGQFETLCGREPRNAGIRGLPPGFDLEAALHRALAGADAVHGHGIRLTSELDEQGLQTAALSPYPGGAPGAVLLDEVSVCSPFWPHRPGLGLYGAHFVGLNSRHIPWDYYDRPADDWMTGHWETHRQTIHQKLDMGPAISVGGCA